MGEKDTDGRKWMEREFVCVGRRDNEREKDPEKRERERAKKRWRERGEEDKVEWRDKRREGGEGE